MSDQEWTGPDQEWTETEHLVFCQLALFFQQTTFLKFRRYLYYYIFKQKFRNTTKDDQKNLYNCATTNHKSSGQFSKTLRHFPKTHQKLSKALET